MTCAVRGPWHAFRVTLVPVFVTVRRLNRIGLEGRKKRHTGTGTEVSSLQFRVCVCVFSFVVSFFPRFCLFVCLFVFSIMIESSPSIKKHFSPLCLLTFKFKLHYLSRRSGPVMDAHCSMSFHTSNSFLELFL